VRASTASAWFTLSTLPCSSSTVSWSGATSNGARKEWWPASIAAPRQPSLRGSSIDDMKVGGSVGSAVRRGVFMSIVAGRVVAPRRGPLRRRVP
jgi:hypothetical protein